MNGETEKYILKMVKKMVGDKTAQMEDPRPPACAFFFHQPVAVRKAKKQKLNN
ncbi:MAG: hypothetical protein J6X94_13480 [Lachnospiraceae bacterium]|nr:hypothetical protein [Lachnospiraceae bacterium]